MNEIKRHKRFTVVIGNPPYSGASVNMAPDARSLVNRYRFVAGEKIEEVKLWLQNDYIKFISFAHSTIERSGSGVWGFITDNSYLDGPTFRGVRHGLADTFASLRILDLHGSAKRRDRTESGQADENAFDITQGVAVVLGAAGNGKDKQPPYYADVLGSREEKYGLLLRGEFSFDVLPWSPPFYLFVPSDHSLREEYDRAFPIALAFVARGNGFMTGRDGFAIGFTRLEVESRLKDFFDLRKSDAEIRGRYGLSDYRAFKVAETRRALKFERSRVVQASYRPF